MKEVSEVLNATARLLNAAADAIEKATNPLLTAPVDADPTGEIALAAAKKRAGTDKPGKKAKAETPAAPAPAAPVAPTPAATAKTLSDEDSLKEIRAVAKVYVQRFGAQADGLAAFRKIMADKCGVAKIDDLKHEQRLTVIEAVKAELAKADEKKPAPAAASTGTEV